MKNDKGICPYCKKEFEVQEYGFKIDCPECGEKVDIFPNMTYVETKLGMFGLPGGWLRFIAKLLK